MSRDNPQRPPLAKRISDLERVIGDQRRQIKELKDTLQVKDNSHAETKDWIGKAVHIVMSNGTVREGVLKWVDKYNFAIVTEDSKTEILLKANVGCIRLEE